MNNHFSTSMNAKGKKEFIETMIFEAQNEITRKRNKE